MDLVLRAPLFSLFTGRDEGFDARAVQLLDVYMGAASVPSDAVVWDMNNPNDLQVHLPSAQGPPADRFCQAVSPCVQRFTSVIMSPWL